MVVHISGAHLNPAVSLAACIMGKLQLYLVPFYIIAQIVGGIIGYGLIIVYCVGPLLGGVLAAVIYRFTFIEGLSNVKKNN
ncbi:aquaporin or aquaglyceroporin related [Holotrichia oblita]|uniref:Aquaporin or aquaglyceroporin related n=2 Tax=Holotrichia oblita TaxID=644536 RepID=A0ACB9TEI2_HOLOL|nr:aquaporin or aquaglyceroporin related [Holotrichia oblita]KAI4465195.1 aquaporin or aquaglyceroporin related [Holotrichia oblita]